MEPGTSFMNTTPQPRWLTVAKAASYCGLSEKTLRRAIRSKVIKSHIVTATGEKSGRRLIDRVSLDAWIEGQPVS